jgi:hypothetical protein
MLVEVGGAGAAWEEQGQPLSARLPGLLERRIEQYPRSYDPLSRGDRDSLSAQLSRPRR